MNFSLYIQESIWIDQVKELLIQSSNKHIISLLRDNDSDILPSDQMTIDKDQKGKDQPSRDQILHRSCRFLKSQILLRSHRLQSKPLQMKTDFGLDIDSNFTSISDVVSELLAIDHFLFTWDSEKLLTKFSF